MSMRFGGLLVGALLLCGASISHAAGDAFTGTIQHLDREASSLALIGGEGDEQTLTVFVDAKTRFQWAQADGYGAAEKSALSFAELAVGDDITVKYLTVDGRHMAEEVSKRAR